MHKIIFVGTAHDDDENGLCNADELLKILRAAEPEVIFEEIRPSDFDSFYKTKHTLEVRAITKYREYKLPQQVPVDRYSIPENHVDEFKKNLNHIFDYVEQKSPECWLLKEGIDRNVQQFGFKYLNSIDHEYNWARICEIQDKTIIATGDQDLIRVLKTWRTQLHMRDLEMIGNIYEYCGKNAFNTGVFLVGATHKAGIVKQIEKYASTEAGLIKWGFAYGQNYGM